MTIIGLTGYAQTGKDTIASYLVDTYGFTRIAFADAVRDGLLALNPIVTHSGPQRIPVRLSQLVSNIGWELAKHAYSEVRVLLQRYGTEAGRNIHGEHCWVHAAMRKMRREEPSGNVVGNYVFTDVRFPNEARELLLEGARIWRVLRPGFGPVNGHPSETAMDDANWFHIDYIVNDGTLDHLYQEVRRLLHLVDPTLRPLKHAP